jgi:hypothetical protein
MSAIDQVIARARQGDVGFSERKQFKLARTRAIEKLRRFALADPYFYILEIIQAAVAGGADYVDIACAEGDVLISWTGGSLREDELAALFDFLFASKERLDLAHVRSLALGVNALMLFEPEQVVIESGDGTPGGTARMVVRAGAESVDVGRAEGALGGTYVRATKLNRDKVAAETGRRGDEDGGLEYGTVEVRCLAAPVPLVFNGQPLFGWSRQRVPNLFGYKQTRSFDEGDLYGTIGLSPTGGDPSFALLTHGVWVQSYQHELIKGYKLGGVVCFDRLHKTVDHSGFVRDDRFEEMWVRLRAHAEALIGGKAAKVEKITSAEGLAYTPTQLRELLREHPRVVVVPPAEGDPELEAWHAKTIARLLDAQLLRVPGKQVSAVRVLGGRDLQIWRPRVDTAEDRNFYAGEPIAAPVEPHLLPAAELDLPSLDELVTGLLEGSDEHGHKRVLSSLRDAGMLPAEAGEGEVGDRIRAALRVMLGETGTIRATLYTPVEPGEAARGLLVRVCSTGHLLGRQLFASAYPGRILDVELPTAQPAVLRAQNLPVRIAERFSALAVPLLREQDRRALAGLGVGKIEPDTPAARLALQVLSRVTVTRLRAARPGRVAPGLSFSLLRPASGFDPFSLPLLRTVSGKALSLRELALLSDATAGLVYGTIPEVPADLEGLDRDRILALDAASERILIAMLGESGYVRVDARDVLTEHQGVRVRDLALGLREFPDFPLPLEGELEGFAQLDAGGREALLDALLTGLVDRMHGRADEAGADPRELEEHRRQAVRQLQRYVCQAVIAGEREALERRGLMDLPLFLDLDGEVWGLRQVYAALSSAEGLLVHYGHVLGSAELGVLSEAARAGRPGGSGGSTEGRPSSLAVSAFCYRLLTPLGRVRLAFDFDLDDLEAARNPMTADAAFLVRESFESAWGTGVLGIPATRLPEYRIQLRARGRGSVAALDELAHLYGVVGSIEIDDADWQENTPEAILAAIDEQAASLLDHLVDDLAEFGDEPRRHEAALRVLLTYAGEQLTLIAGPEGLAAQAATVLAQRILGLPLFDTGAATLISAQRMIELFRRHFEAAHALGREVPPFDWGAVLVDGAPGLVRVWLDAHLQPARVVMPASASASPRSVAADADADADAGREPWNPERAMSLDVLAWNLEHWLEQLRPDPRDLSDRHNKPTRVWVAPYDVAEGGLISGGDRRVELYALHDLAVRMSEAPTPTNLAWLLLAIYAHLNAISALITNTHEAQFQLVVGEALSSGELRPLEPKPGEVFEH